MMLKYMSLTLGFYSSLSADIFIASLNPIFLRIWLSIWDLFKLKWKLIDFKISWVLCVCVCWEISGSSILLLHRRITGLKLRRSDISRQRNFTSFFQSTAFDLSRKSDISGRRVAWLQTWDLSKNLHDRTNLNSAWLDSFFVRSSMRQKYFFVVGRLFFWWGGQNFCRSVRFPELRRCPLVGSGKFSCQLIFLSHSWRWKPGQCFFLQFT